MLIAELTLSSSILEGALANAPGVTVTLDQQYARETGTSLLQVQATGDGLGGFDAALDDDPTVSDAVVLCEADGWRQYRITLSPEGDDASTYYARTELDAVLLNAEATVDGWSLRMQFPDRASVSAYRQRCIDTGLSFQLHRLYRGSPNGRTRYGLTAAQEAVLTAAFEAGYFEVPRRCSLADIGEKLGISGQAASERLRRGLQALLQSTLSSREPTRRVDTDRQNTEFETRDGTAD
ncbi:MULTISPECIES: helix-turn-helix domain-containing protein [Haloprofundus]|uniref:helix-turn-helix domain-containing protein n=1 Tax=Haloprofundus TaxID=1911573 RepID=UPI000E43B960|nr:MULTISPECIES: helix-turn-helix domain-containing protein [Haloprofundus]QCJ47467.1 bacterio-opsin activator [Haloprofundus sp. MHR1]